MPEMTWTLWEQLLLAILALGTIALFTIQVSKIIKIILAGKPDRNRLDRLGRRLWVTFKEVVFQTRVVTGRPIPGILHALVFFGFVAFGAETIDHFLEPYGFHFIRTLFGESGEPVFKSFITVMAWLVIIGIVGLAFRRFVLIKISPDPKSYSSGLVALFILLLMVTYLNGIAAEPVAEKANWWLHALIIIVFPQLILGSKHFHLLISPFDIFFRTHRLGDLLPLNLDMEAMAAAEEVNLGLEKISQVPRKLRMDFFSCVECRRCTDQCPANIAGQELNPRGFILAGRATLKNASADDPVIGVIISETALGQCTSCGACENICPVGIEHLQLLTGAKRAQALAIGKGMVATEYLQTVERYGNPFSASRDVRSQLIAELGIPIYEKGKTEYVLWLGCVWGYNKDVRSAVEAMVTVLKTAGVSFGVLQDETCTGHHSRRQGEEMQFQTLAKTNTETLKSSDVKKIITPCPHCLHTVGREYKDVDASFNVEIIHHSEFLADLIAKKQIVMDEKQNGVKTTYHDPCYLGRYEGIFDAPRQVIAQAGCEVTELPRHGEKSYCCGGGNAGFAREQKVTKRVDQVRKDEIKNSGAKLLITSCPECKMMLNAAVEETKDIAELVAERMRGQRAVAGEK
jgi:Fe-S oxidoreductase